MLTITEGWEKRRPGDELLTPTRAAAMETLCGDVGRVTHSAVRNGNSYDRFEERR